MVGTKPRTPFLRQRVTNRVYVWTEFQHKREDMIPMTQAEYDDYKLRGILNVSDAELERREREQIEFASEEGEESEVHDLVEGPAADGEQKEKVDFGAIEDHPDWDLIEGFETKNQVEEYMLKKFKLDIDRRMNLQNLKKMARRQLRLYLEKRLNRSE